MIISFTLQNYKSYKNEITLNFISNSKIRIKHDHEHKVNGLDIIKNCGIFGNNAAGKSNVIKALSLLKSIVLGQTIIDDFSFKGKEDTPTIFDIVFSDFNENIYEYKVEILKKHDFLGGYEILSEALYNIKTTGTFPVFVSTLKNIQLSDDNDSNLSAYVSGYKNTQNMLFLTYMAMPDKVIASNKIKLHIVNAYNFFAADLIIFSKGNGGYTFVNSSNIKQISKYLKMFDTGIEDISFIPCPQEEVLRTLPMDSLNLNIQNARIHNIDKFSLFTNKDLFEFNLINDSIVIKKLVSKHANIENSFNLESESDGTIRIMLLVAMMFNETYKNKVLIVDEIESSIHNEICSYLIETFQRFNADKNNQIVFTSNCVRLMDDILRKDEIYLVEKDSEGISNIISLNDFNIRSDTKISKNYTEGRYGGVPNLKHYL